MPTRTCLTCRKLITKGSYCKTCTRTKGYHSPEYTHHRKALLKAHIDKYGQWCPGDRYHQAHHCLPNNPLQVDHITPLGMGGSNNIGNLRVLCSKGNQGRVGYPYSPTKGRVVKLHGV